MTTGLKRGLLLALAVLVLDQGTKWWIVERVMDPPQVVEVTSFFNLVMGWNRGVSFGLFNESSAAGAWILTGLALAIVTALLVWLRRAEEKPIQFAIGAIIGGALGNVVDRVRYGAVADFLDVHAWGYHWPAFNVADSAITLGAVALVLDSLFRGTEKNKKAGGADQTGTEA